MRLFFLRTTAIALLGMICIIPDKVFAQAQPINYKFDFGKRKAEKGYTKVSPETTFNDDKGYGFDLKTLFPTASSNKKNQPFYFSVKVPEGNYKVTVSLGDAHGASVTTVRAESRRLMLEEVKTSPGTIKKISFIVNIRKPQISSGGKVSLKPREVGNLDWDDKLTLEFNNSNPVVDAIEIEKVENQVTVYLAGNSTVVDQDEEPWASWGQMITRFLKPGVAIANHAASGLSLGSFLGSHRLDKILSLIKPGDYLFIEFGHNDQKEKGPEDGAYGSYTQRLKLFIHKVREYKGIPVKEGGISPKKLDEILWFGKSEKIARNNRSVNIAKLKSVLEKVGNCKLSKDTGYWRIDIDYDQVYMDYYEYLQIIRNKEQPDKQKIADLLIIIKRGPLLLNTDYDWLNDFKSEISHEVIDLFLKFAKSVTPDSDPEFIIQIANHIFYFDPVNENAMILKCRALAQLGKHTLAKYTFDKFTKDFKAIYGVEFEKSFQSISNPENPDLN